MVSKSLLKCVTVLVLLLSIAVSANAQQLSKEKKKALKKELRKMSPEELWQLKNDQQEQKATIITLEKENESLHEQLAEQAQDLEMKQGENEQLESDHIKDDNAATRQLGTTSSVSEEGEWSKGVVFRVQIGALTEKEYEKEIPSGFSLEVEHKGDLKRMVVGYYRDYEEADTFKKLMRKLGIRTAWIVPYKDGQRVPLKDVLGQVVD
ncbi:SPOR domain-containing protein [Echinicola strongylocentroti]|uniref:SPOR domain-containing protein n=1 Tax=Echinicola strongylocentroti TaxID=1795355 RepID=A0A2Z4IJW0_9BACT|nr:SPOR domain-containing protein [Echinicola strongylocentroti]AWW30979.1 SPOR domain-containing protein [Echinicola strongylocentroti]